MVPAPNKHPHHMQMTMIEYDDYDDDESSVESEYIAMKGSDSIPCLDDISLPSFRASNIARNASFESVFSQASVEICLAPLVAREEEQKKRGRLQIVSNVPDTFVAKSDARNASDLGLQRDSALSGSCNSIKDQLHFGCINEHADYVSLGWSDSDMESSSDDDSDVEDEKPVLPRKKPEKYIKSSPRFQLNRSNATNTAAINAIDQSSTSDAESSVDDNIINTILRKTDSREQMRGSTRKVKTARQAKKTKQAKKIKQAAPAKVKAVGATSDPLLNLFLEHRRELISPKSAGKAGKISSSGSRRQAEHVVEGHSSSSTSSSNNSTTQDNDSLLGSILNKTDSLNHVSESGRRVVKTIKDPRHQPNGARRSSLGCSDELMQRFLSSTSKDAPWTPKRASMGTSSAQSPSAYDNSDQTFTSCDSLNRLEGKGQRVVRTRTTSTSNQ